METGERDHTIEQVHRFRVHVHVPRALAEYSKLEYVDLEVEVEGVIKKTNSGYSFTEVVVRPNLTISVEQEQTRAVGRTGVGLRVQVTEA